MKIGAYSILPDLQGNNMAATVVTPGGPLMYSVSVMLLHVATWIVAATLLLTAAKNDIDTYYEIMATNPSTTTASMIRMMAVDANMTNTTNTTTPVATTRSGQEAVVASVVANTPANVDALLMVTANLIWGILVMAIIHASFARAKEESEKIRSSLLSVCLLSLVLIVNCFGVSLMAVVAGLPTITGKTNPFPIVVAAQCLIGAGSAMVVAFLYNWTAHSDADSIL